MFHPQTDRQTRERQYAESLAEYSLQGLMAARKQHFLAEHRRMYPDDDFLSPTSPEPLARSTIRSYAHAAAAAGVAARLRASPSATNARAYTHGDDSLPAIGKEEVHPRRTRNGTPKPNINELLRLASLSDDAMSPSGNSSNQTSLDSMVEERREPMYPVRSPSGSESSQGHGHSRQWQRQSGRDSSREATTPALFGKCAEPTYSLGFRRRKT